MKHQTLKTLGIAIACSLEVMACRQSLDITGDQLQADLLTGSQDPIGLTASEQTDTTITLSWTEVATDEYSYEVEKCTGASCTTFEASPDSPIPADSATHQETGLTPNTTYRFRLRVVRPSGKGEWLESGDFTTLSTPSSSFSVGAITATSITFSWTDQATNESGYEVQRCIGAGCSTFSPVSGSPLAANAITHTEGGLSAGTVYRFRVRPISTNDDSAWLTGTDVVTLLTPPTAITAAAKTNASLSVTWDDPSTTETGFQIQSCAGTGCVNYTTVASSPLAANSTSHTESGLSPSAIYRFRVRVLSELGPSDWTQTTDIITAPADPTGLTLSSGTDTGLVIAWTDVATNEFVYEVQRCTSASCTDFSAVASSPLAANSTGLSESSLSPSTVYRYRVRATTATGDSSGWVVSSDLSTGPTAPTDLVTSAVTNSAITLDWTDNAAGSETYEVESCAGVSCSNFSAVASSPLAANSVTHTETNLTGSTSYTFRVRAVSGSSKSAWLTSSPVSTLAPVSACTSPTTVVIDRGVKSNAAVMARGQWSDVKVIPSSTYPSTAYYDGSATGGTLGIKFAYWDEDHYEVESVAGDLALAAGSASWIKLAYLSTGVPMVFWVSGSTTIRGAMRSAALGTAGVWNSAILETFAGGATRALEVSVSPEDHVGLVYLTNTAVTGRARFIYCPSGCTSLSSFVAMTTGATDYVENVNITGAAMGTGVAWCRTSAGTPGNFIPLVSYTNSATNVVRYSRCTGALSTCRALAGWSGSTVASVVSTFARVYVDPTVVSDVPKVLYRNASTSLAVATNANGCGSAAGVWTSSGAIGGASTGTGWANLMADASGKWHIVANEAATSVVYYNSTTTTSTGAWNAVGTVETVALAAAGAGGGGAAISTSAGEIFTTYAQSAVSPNQLLMSVINDVSVASSSAISHQVVPDTTGNIGLSLTAGGIKPNVMTASTSTGKPGVVYVDHSSGVAATALLKYSFRDGTTAATPWEDPRILYVPGTPSSPSLAYDHLDLPWIGYFDATNFKFYLATNNLSDGSGAWSYYQFPLNGKTAAAVAPAVDMTSVEMAYSGGVASPVMIVMNSTAAGGPGVKIAKFDRAANEFGTLVITIQGMGAGWGSSLSADYDKNGNMIVGFYDITAARVKFNASDDGGTTWYATSVDLPYTSAVTSGREGLSLRINPYNSKPGVSYYDRISNKVGYVTCSTSLSSCSSAGNWSATDVDTSAGVSGITITTLEQLLSTTLTYGSTGVPTVLYARGMGATTPGLFRADNSTGSFVPAALVSSATANLTGQTAAVAAVNYANAGWSVSSVRNSLGHLMSTYIGPNNWLYATSCGD